MIVFRGHGFTAQGAAVLLQVILGRKEMGIQVL